MGYLQDRFCWDSGIDTCAQEEETTMKSFDNEKKGAVLRTHEIATKLKL